jgi:hypothetical protein
MHVSPRAFLEAVVAILTTPVGPIVGFVPMAPVVAAEAGSTAAVMGIVAAAEAGSMAAVTGIVAAADSIPVAEIVPSVSPLSCKM